MQLRLLPSDMIIPERYLWYVYKITASEVTSDEFINIP